MLVGHFYPDATVGHVYDVIRLAGHCGCDQPVAVVVGVEQVHGPWSLLGVERSWINWAMS